MLGLLVDMLVIWFLLNYFSEHDWDDRKFQVFMITLGIVVCGNLAGAFLAPYIGFFVLGVYVLIGGLLLRIATDLNWKKSFKAMGIFLTYKIIFMLIIAGIGMMFGE